MKYTEVTLTLSPVDPVRDLLIDALGNNGPYDSFVETPDGLKAYVPTAQFDAAWLQEQINNLQQLSTFNCQLSTQAMPDKDWNEEWERQHQPVLVEAANGKRIWVRAPFHDHRTDVDYEIEIEPKMSFGTAHHATTYMMLSYLAELPLEGLRVLDMGCGTAVLGILAKMRGASYVEGIDIDEWAFNNALENVQRNAVAMTIRIGDASLLNNREDKFHLIIANINRNILLHDMAAYASVLNPGGTLLLSGFYESDIPALQSHAAILGLQLQQTKTRQSWAALRMSF
ncbi:MAG: 50S ribosomal protein L11 methyltransferase [Bacteroidales bacterium]|nr:50S ribosomal protein L11 methyltransferase [Bacteroidales bacterium]